MLRVIVFITALLIAGPGVAKPVRYGLDTTGSSVGFSFMVGKTRIDGHIPIIAADLVIDFQSAERSSVTVRLDATHVRAGFFLATQAMREPSVLDVAKHPEITFRSTAIRLEGDVVHVDGMAGMRGVEKPMSLTAALFRGAETAPDDLDMLILHLSGTFDRREFGASGYPDMVGAMIAIYITAQVVRVD